MVSESPFVALILSPLLYTLLSVPSTTSIILLTSYSRRRPPYGFGRMKGE